MEAELEELATAPITPSQALGEYLAAKAATTKSQSEAEAFARIRGDDLADRARPGSARGHAAHLLRGASVLTRVFSRHPGSRPAVRLVPGIVASRAQTLARHSAGGADVRPADVAAMLGGVTRRVLTDPRWQSGAVRRHARGLAQVHRRRRAHRGVLPPGQRRRHYDGRPVDDQAPPDQRPRDVHQYPRYPSTHRIRARGGAVRFPPGRSPASPSPCPGAPSARAVGETP